MVVDNQGSYITWSQNIRYQGTTYNNSAGSGAMVFCNNKGLGGGGWHFVNRTGVLGTQITDSGELVSNAYRMNESGTDTGMYSGGDNVLQFKSSNAVALTIGPSRIDASKDLYDKNGDLITGGGGGGGGWEATPAYISLSLSGSQLLTTTFTKLSGLTVLETDSTKAITRSSGTITFLQGGVYQIGYVVFMRQTSGGNRLEMRAKFYSNGSAIEASTSSGYSRNTVQEGTSCSGSMVKQFSANDTLEVRVSKDSGVTGEVESAVMYAYRIA